MRNPFVKPKFGEQINPAHLINRNLVGAWILNEGMGNRIGDSTWRRNQGTALNNPTWTDTTLLAPSGANITYAPPDWGPVLNFNGSNQSIDIPYKSYYDSVNTHFAIEVVYRVTGNFGTEAGVFTRNGFNPGTAGTWGLFYNGVQTSISVGTTTQPGRLSMADGRFHHIVGTWDGSQLHLFEDAREARAPISLTSYTDTSGADFVMAKSITGGGFLNGDILLARFWMGRSLNLNDVMQLYAQPFLNWMPSVQQRWWFLQPKPATLQSFEAKANIRGVTDRRLQALARIRTITDRSFQAKAAITSRVSVTLQTKASIDIPQTPIDRQLESWSINDQFSVFSREFTLQVRSLLSLAVGNQVTIAAGYDASRVQEMNGQIDRIQKQTTPDSQIFTVTGRDFGARELSTHRITKTWNSYPPTGQLFNVDDQSHFITVWSAHGIISEVCQFMGLTVGALEFPDYQLYNNYVAVGKRGLDIIEELMAPFNQFGRIRYISQVRDRVLSVIKVDWQNPVPAGCNILSRSMIASQQRSQELYLDEPRLNEVSRIIIRGAAYSIPRTTLGITVRTEYFRNITMAEVGNSIIGVVSAPGENLAIAENAAQSKEVVNEISTVELLFGDKVLQRESWTYTNDELTEHSLERNFYYEPGTPFIQNQIIGDVADLEVVSAGPSEKALLFLIHTKREGLTDVNGVTIFREIFRQTTQYYFDKDQQIACEETSTQEFDSSTGTWGVTTHTSRHHSQTTGGALRTHLLNFIFEDSRFKLQSADVQQIGGIRPSINQPASRFGLISVQVQSPQGDLDTNGNPIDLAADPNNPGQSLYTWTYENPYLGQETADDVYQLALDEQAFQQTTGRWETVVLEMALLMPNLFVGMPVTVERDDGSLRDYWVEEVNHNFTAVRATSSVRVKRITTEGLS